MMVADPVVPAARPDGNARHMNARARQAELDLDRACSSIAIALPWVFYDWSHRRQSGFVISMLSQMGMMIILALSYNMLLGQAGLFSLCHATFFGIGGYATIHFLNCAGAGDLPVPMELMPLLAGLAGLGARDRVRLHGDQAARHRVRDDHARHRRTDDHRGADVPSFLRRRGRRHHQPHDRPQPVRPQIRLRHPGLLPDPGLDR